MTEPTDRELDDMEDLRLNRMIEDYEHQQALLRQATEPVVFEAARPAINEHGDTVFWITGDDPFPDPWIETDLVINGWSDDTPK